MQPLEHLWPLNECGSNEYLLQTYHTMLRNYDRLVPRPEFCGGRAVYHNQTPEKSASFSFLS